MHTATEHRILGAVYDLMNERLAQYLPSIVGMPKFEMLQSRCNTFELKQRVMNNQLYKKADAATVEEKIKAQVSGLLDAKADASTVLQLQTTVNDRITAIEIFTTASPDAIQNRTSYGLNVEGGYLHFREAHLSYVQEISATGIFAFEAWIYADMAPAPPFSGQHFTLLSPYSEELYSMEGVSERFALSLEPVSATQFMLGGGTACTRQFTDSTMQVDVVNAGEWTHVLWQRPLDDNDNMFVWINGKRCNYDLIFLDKTSRVLSAKWKLGFTLGSSNNLLNFKGRMALAHVGSNQFYISDNFTPRTMYQGDVDTSFLLGTNFTDAVSGARVKVIGGVVPIRTEGIVSDV